MRKVLVVDDNVPLAENISEILSDAELGDAIVAGSGARALELLRSDRFDVMLTDMRMPEMGGTELIRRAREIDPELPVVVVTAFTSDDEVAQALREGLLMIFGKPVPTTSLIEFISRAQRGRPILIVEDDLALAENVADVLRERGMSTVIAHSVAEIDRVGGVPAVALVDLRLPGSEDGASVERVKARFPETALVLMTAFLPEMGSLPAVPVMEKPFDTARLLELVETLSAQLRRQA
jgi:DNA-binding NtrC family response regulator